MSGRDRPRTLLVRSRRRAVGRRESRLRRDLRRHHGAVSAQRKAAWADVARRIAHEIKNPLTPIQLSAERLKPKISQARSQRIPRRSRMCTETIIRQVDDIGRMVDEFSAFARMPQPGDEARERKSNCASGSVPSVQRPAPASSSRPTFPERGHALPCDGRQISQALTNLLQNAVDADRGRRLPTARTAAGPDRRDAGGPGRPRCDRHRRTTARACRTRNATG